MATKILGISGTPIKKGNMDTFLATIMAMASEKGLETETIHLSEMEIKNCVHCNFCLAKQKEGKYRALKDDAQVVFEKMEPADIIVLASPVYFMRTSGMMATFIDRLRVFIFGNIAGGKLRNKIGMSAGVSWLRHGGMETTHLSHLYAFYTLDMIPATIHSCISPMGASAVSSRHGEAAFDPAVRIGVNEDQAGLQSAKAHLSRALELAALINTDQ
ncbi:flavodoxin family protein [Desulfosarcina sp. OttesenSCG-928-A07]|nr:flavodoxin family protein [Desulfosarcina sp. OttesenSCG-928-A07]